MSFYVEVSRQIDGRQVWTCTGQYRSPTVANLIAEDYRRHGETARVVAEFAPALELARE